MQQNRYETMLSLLLRCHALLATHVSQQMQAERFGQACIVTFIGALEPLAADETLCNLFDSYWESKTRKLHIVTMLASPPRGPASSMIDDERVLTMHDAFRRLATHWFNVQEETVEEKQGPVEKKDANGAAQPNLSKTEVVRLTEGTEDHSVGSTFSSDVRTMLKCKEKIQGTKSLLLNGSQRKRRLSEIQKGLKG